MAKKVSDIELRGIINSEITNALGYMGGNLSSQRKKSLEYYMGEPLGTEIDGRSQVVSTDVADTIETILPNLLRVFTSSEKVVKCEPVKVEDVKLAEQVTNYINYIFNKDNDGFSVLYTWFKDALLEKNGIIKVYWDESESVEQETYQNLSDDEYRLLIEDDDVEVVQEESFEDETAKAQLEVVKAMAIKTGEIMPEMPIPMMHNCIIKRTNGSGKVKIENIPPEEFLIQRSAKTIEDANFVAHRVSKTRSELVEMGFDQKIIDDLPTSNEILLNDERLQRYSDIDQTPFNDSPDKSTEEIELFECYIRVDTDGDGIAELRKVTVAGTGGYTILENMACDNMPFCSITPIPMPHRFYGRSVSELVEDVQLVKSTVMRQLLDNMYLTNNNRVAIMDGMVNLDDLLTSRPGGVVRTKQPPSQVMMPMQSQAISQQAFPLLEYLDTVRESRTGVTRQLQAFQLQGGQEYPMVSLKNIYNTLSKIVENAGLKNVDNYFVNPDMGKSMVQPPQQPAPTPIEKIEFTRIASEEKRKNAQLELELKELKSRNAGMLLDQEIKMKELELKYNAQIDTQQMRADADLNKILVSESIKDFRNTNDKSQMLQNQIESLNEQPGTSQSPKGIDPIEQG